jgi:hypothetical protein
MISGTPIRTAWPERTATGAQASRLQSAVFEPYRPKAKEERANADRDLLAIIKLSARVQKKLRA